MPFRKISFFNTTRTTVITALLAMAIAMLCLSGWIFDREILRTLGHNWASMKVNTALGIIFSAVSLLLFASGKKKWMALLLAFIVFLIGTVSLCEYLFHWNAHIDELFFLDKNTLAVNYPGRMAKIATISFIVFGISLLFYPFKKKYLQRVSEFSAILILVNSFIIFIAYLYSAGLVLQVEQVKSISLPTILSGLLLSSSILFSRPDNGFLAAFHKKTTAARVGVKGFFIIILTLVFLGWLCLKAEETGLFDKTFSLAIRIIVYSMIFFFVTWASTKSLNMAEEELQESEAKYRAFFENSIDGILLTAQDGRILTANSAACVMFGMTEQEICETSRSGLVDKEDDRLPAFLQRLLQAGKAIGELNFIRKGGSKFPAEISSAVFNDAAGKQKTSMIIRDITERKNNEDSLKRKQQDYVSLVNTIDGIVWEADAKTFAFSFVSEKAERLLGYRVEKWINEPGFWANHIHPDDRIWAVEYCVQCTLDMKLHEFEYRMIAADGSIVWLRDIVSVITENNEPIRLRGIMIDITEQKKADHALKESEEKYRTLIEQASDPILIYSLDGKIQDYNNAFMSFTGYQKKDIKNLNLTDMLFKEDLKDKPLLFGKIKAENSVHDERRAKKKDGTAIFVELNSKMMPDGNIMIIARNITDRKKAEAQMIKEKSLSDSIINSLPGLFYLIDEKGKHIRWNKLKEDISGYTAAEISQMNSIDFFEGEERKLIRQRVIDGFINGVTDAEAHLVTKSGKRILFYFTGVAIEYEGKKCLVGTGIDISDRKKAEQRLEESYKAIRKLTEHLQNIREEERAHIAREIHDELGQQLTVIKMDVSWMNKKMAVKDEASKARMKDLLAMLDDAVKSIRRISSELRPSLLDDLGLTAAMEWQLTEFKKRFDIKTHLNFPDIEIKLPDALRTGLFRIFQESLTNVARHSKAKIVTVELNQQNGSVVLSVSDDGVGFDKQNTAGRKTLGILGMKERTAMLGGNYEIISQPGKGTRVIVTIPLNNTTKINGV